MSALSTIPANRRAVLIGQAGDRSDADTAELTQAVWAYEPDFVVAKELPHKLRGRKLGELSALIATELRRLGAPDDAIVLANDEVRQHALLLNGAQPGDMLILLIHEDRDEIMELLDNLQARGWKAGQPLDP